MHRPMFVLRGNHGRGGLSEPRSATMLAVPRMREWRFAIREALPQRGLRPATAARPLRPLPRRPCPCAPPGSRATARAALVEHVKNLAVVCNLQ